MSTPRPSQMKQLLLDRRLLEFNLFPSLSLHPSHREEFLGPQADSHIQAEQICADYWHRHWSAAILDRIGLRDTPFMPLEPTLALKLALLPPASLIACMRHIGVSLCTPRLRRTIAGTEVRAMISFLDPSLLQFVRQGDMPASPVEDSLGWSLQQAMDAIEPMGQAVLMQIFDSGGPALSRRARLKLPAMPAGDSPISESQAMSLAGNIMHTLDPSWLSSFSTMH